MRYSLLVVFLWGCLEAPQKPELHNPLSEPPETTILEGPDEGETVRSAQVGFRWQGNTRFVREFQYRLDGSAWSTWGPGTSATLVLDEGEHTFEVKSRIPPEQDVPGIEEVVPELRGPFVVDALQGPALWLSPRQVSVKVGETVALKVMAEEVTDLMLAHLEVRYDQTRLNWVEAQAGTFLGLNGAEVLEFEKPDQARALGILDLGAAGGQPHGVSGSGVLAELRFRATARGNAEVRLGDSTQVRDSVNLPLGLKGMESCAVVVE